MNLFLQLFKKLKYLFKFRYIPIYHILHCLIVLLQSIKYSFCWQKFNTAQGCRFIMSALGIIKGIFMAVTNNIREQRGIYQDDLAAAIGFSTKTVGRIERGDSTPSAEFMLRISKYFNFFSSNAMLY